MKKKHNAAIIILAARIPLLFKVLNSLQNNWNDNYNYPIYIHTFGNLINSELKKEINTRISKNIHFCEIIPRVPDHISEKDIFYNRKYLNYVSKAFPKKRIGYLHMCYFKTNITSYGSVGCLSEKLKSYDQLMFYDDDNVLNRKIEYDFFDPSTDFPIVTADTSINKDDRDFKETSENLWLFYSSFLKQNNIIPKDSILKKAFMKNDEKEIYKLTWSCGYLEVYNLKLIQNKYWKNYINLANEFGGNYKHRWGDFQLINLFVRTFFENPIKDLNLVKKNILNPKIQGSDEFIYYKSLDSYNSKLFKFLIKLKKIIYR